MARLLTISAVTLRAGINNIGDIVAIMPDDHVFSKAETDGFKIIDVVGKVEEIKSDLEKMNPDLSAFMVADKDNPEKKELDFKFPKYCHCVNDESKTTISEICKTNIVAVKP